MLLQWTGPYSLTKLTHLIHITLVKYLPEMKHSFKWQGLFYPSSLLRYQLVVLRLNIIMFNNDDEQHTILIKALIWNRKMQPCFNINHIFIVQIWHQRIPTNKTFTHPLTSPPPSQHSEKLHPEQNLEFLETLCEWLEPTTIQGTGMLTRIQMKMEV